ncbi:MULTISPECIES: DUF4419 domain-containing protein [Sphingobacterium]|uniref:DUF4419 domain-containing protein n=1 Tax=Sphingobacterium TaxID=28453 RepID=UPI0013DD4B4F|nr:MULTISPECIES: DUF4419 domain-containing protein [unclassified Sphingobacterium]
MKATIYCLIVVVFLHLDCPFSAVGQVQEKHSLRKVLIKASDISTAGDTITLHASSTRYMINDTLLKPSNALRRVSKQALMDQLSTEEVEYFSIGPDSLVLFGAHPFLAGAFKAYQEHRPIIISPDIIWTLIEQGFARHIALYAEKFRDRLVDFQGKREITIVANKDDIQLGNPNSKWGSVLPQFTEQIEKFTGKAYTSNLRADFSTTNTDSRIASEIILMESVKSFFDYRMMVMGCGISAVTLEGSVADWEHVLKKMDYIETFDLSWWTNELRPIVQQIVQTKKGDLDKGFWSDMLQLRNKQAYAPHETIDGWIVKFYPFNDKGEQRELEPIGNISTIAAEYVKVPFVLEDKEKDMQYTMEIWAGLFGMEQDQKSFSLKPAIGWSIVHRGGVVSNDLPQKESYDIVSLKNIKELPESIYSIKSIKSLELGFIGKVNVADKIKSINIKRLTIKGDIDADGIKRLKELMPKAWVIVNDKKI